MSALRVALTRFSWKALPAAARSSQRALAPAAAVNGAVWRRYGHGKPVESDEDFDARWLAYFQQPELDAWDLKKGVNELYGHDLVPEPKIVVAMLQAARRLNDIALAIRILEAIKSKAAGDKEIYSYVLSEIKPTLDELGIRTPEELGLA